MHAQVTRQIDSARRRTITRQLLRKKLRKCEVGNLHSNSQQRLEFECRQRVADNFDDLNNGRQTPDDVQQCASLILNMMKREKGGSTRRAMHESDAN